MKRIVIKIGSQIILDDEESNSNYLSNILNEIVSLKSKGFSFTIVSSGAVALAKKQIYRKEAELGTFVFENIEKNGALESTEAQHMIKTLIELHGELKEFETALSELRKTSDKTEENQEASEDR